MARLPFAALQATSMLPPQMATAIKPVQKPGVEEAEAAPIHRIRITLTAKNVKSLEKGEVEHLGDERCRPRMLMLAPLPDLPRSVRRPDPDRQGQAGQGEGPRAHAHSRAEDHHPQVSLR